MVCLNISSMNLLDFSKCTSSYLSNMYHHEIVHRHTLIMVPGQTLMTMKWSVVVVSMCVQKFSSRFMVACCNIRRALLGNMQYLY